MTRSVKGIRLADYTPSYPKLSNIIRNTVKAAAIKVSVNSFVVKLATSTFTVRSIRLADYTQSYPKLSNIIRNTVKAAAIKVYVNNFVVKLVTSTCTLYFICDRFFPLADE